MFDRSKMELDFDDIRGMTFDQIIEDISNNDDDEIKKLYGEGQVKQRNIMQHIRREACKLCDLRTFVKVTPTKLKESEVDELLSLKDNEYTFYFFEDSKAFVHEEHIHEAIKNLDQGSLTHSQKRNKLTAGGRQPSNIGENPFKRGLYSTRPNRPNNPPNGLSKVSEEEEEDGWRAEKMISTLYRKVLPLHPHRLRRSIFAQVDPRLAAFKCALKNTMLHFKLVSENILNLSDEDFFQMKCTTDG